MDTNLLTTRLIEQYRVGGRGTGRTHSMLERAHWMANQGKKVWVVCESPYHAQVLSKMFGRTDFGQPRTVNWVEPNFTWIQAFDGDNHLKIEKSDKLVVDETILEQLLRTAVHFYE